MDTVLQWCTRQLGTAEVLSDRSKEHPGHASGTWHLKTPVGFCYLKVHDDALHWANEVHAYEHWACAFGDRAPSLLAVRDVPPLALVVSEIPGEILEGMHLDPRTERAIWREAGEALPALHELESGASLGPCNRDGTPVGAPRPDAVTAIAERFAQDIERAIQGASVSETELVTLRAAHDLIPAFAGERPTPCHRDYCAANWLVDEDGNWAGVIDFEFAYWDVRVVDFARDPNWAWVIRPDLVAAFMEGYGRPLSAAAEQQCLVARAEYALGAILWGRDNAYYRFAREGHEALAYLRDLLGGETWTTRD
ncbi:MAG: aminoglycoside phosphotransferase family protein [Anaerolineae bacterium]|nr:aminoglycoside phosphotransferase family protein [Anaerolineae bacterium]